MTFSARQFTFTFPRPVQIMGIINVTPDSFFDGGRYFDTAKAVEHGVRLAAEGADYLDVGGESTRPNATPVAEAEEMRRVLPVIEQLAARVSAPLSIDTVKTNVARAAIRAGASIINDVAANRQDEDMWELAAETSAGYVAMHMQGTPQTMQQNPIYRDVVQDVSDFFGQRLARLAACGLRPEQVVLDVGIGFGKTLEHNLQLLAGLEHFRIWQRPLLVGVSRKSFMGKLLDVEADGRLPGGLACACWAAAAGINIIRTHDVAATLQAVRMFELLQARKQCD
jgi:dihydropteroate synthase